MAHLNKDGIIELTHEEIDALNGKNNLNVNSLMNWIVTGNKEGRFNFEKTPLNRKLKVSSDNESRVVPIRRVKDYGYVSDDQGCVEPDYEIKKY